MGFWTESFAPRHVRLAENASRRLNMSAVVTVSLVELARTTANY